tara:strand:+ start:431 stop:1510 length:1080 start_codon:yes stop_codon:yes gene_type:complete
LSKKINLLGYSFESLKVFFSELGEPEYRAKQLLSWIHQKGVTDFDLMTDFNKNLRNKLKSISFIKPPEVYKVYLSNEGTKKYLIKLDSGSIIEMVIIPEKNRRTLCVSSQAGCALQCSFCATGAQGFDQDLTSDEIIGQLWLANFNEENSKSITNVVYMGMGEPLLNYEAVLESAKIMKHQNSYGLSKKRITISTSGIAPKINKLSEDIDVSLAISLHAPDDKLRDQIVPINKKYPINSLMQACKDYLSNFESKKNITMEYIMIDGVNDSMNHAKKLATLLSNISCKINLIPFNSFKGSDYKRSKESSMKSFKNYLMSKGFVTTLRVTRGDGVDAACGQLVGELSNAIKGKNVIKHKSI